MFGREIDKEILDAALASPQNEICGYIDANKQVKFMMNVARDPRNEFEIANVPDDALAIFHSHPGGPFHPTELDAKQQLATAIPWAIACFNELHSEIFWFGDGAPKAPLIGRGFRHYVTDCYALIRDFYMTVHAIELPEFPREWEWWKTEKMLYLDGFQEAGFHEISKADILPGDVFFATVHAKSPNHAGIYLGNGLILHHSAARQPYDPSRLSTVEPAGNWTNLLSKVIRHENDNINRSIGQNIWP